MSTKDKGRTGRACPCEILDDGGACVECGLSVPSRSKKAKISHPAAAPGPTAEDVARGSQAAAHAHAASSGSLAALSGGSNLPLPDTGSVRAAGAWEGKGTSGPASLPPIVQTELGPARLPLSEEEMQRQCDDISSVLRRNEAKYPVWNPAAKYIKYRRIIVDWMSEVGEEYHLTPLTIHMAVKHLDRILSTLDVHKTRLQLVAICCLLIAAKYEELDPKVPAIADLNECSNDAYTPELIKEMEVMVLNHLQWSLDAITPLHFLHLFLTQGITFEKDIVDGKPFTKKAARYVKKYVTFFADLCLQDHGFLQYPPSILAAAIIAASRRAVKVDPIWNDSLQALTKYKEKHIYPAYKHIYNHFEATFPASQPNASSPIAVQQFEARATAPTNTAL